MNYLDKEKQKMKRHEQYLKRKASETKEQRDKRLSRGKKYRQKMKNSNLLKNETILNLIENNTYTSSVKNQKLKKQGLF